MNDEIKEMLDLINELVKISPNKGRYGISHKKWKQLLDYITNLQQLCDKYEEEHNTTFKEWQKDIQANKEAIEILERDYHIKGEDRDLYEVLTRRNVWEENNGNK